MENNYAALESQLGSELCKVEDTEEIFWLKASDDFQSKVKAGDLLVRQYRFKDAIMEYEKALRIKQNDRMLYIKLGGAYLTLFNFEEAEHCYRKAMESGAKEGTVAFYLGIKNFLQGNYQDAIENFERTDVNNGEMLIAVIYWHTISSFRMGVKTAFLEKYDRNLDVGHHNAYKTAVELFVGQLDPENIESLIPSLDSVIVFYGVYEYLIAQNKTKDAELYLAKVLEYTDVWPCIAYLAAYNSANKRI